MLRVHTDCVWWHLNKSIPGCHASLQFYITEIVWENVVRIKKWHTQSTVKCITDGHRVAKCTDFFSKRVQVWRLKQLSPIWSFPCLYGGEGWQAWYKGNCYLMIKNCSFLCQFENLLWRLMLWDINITKKGNNKIFFNPLTLMSDQERISRYNKWWELRKISIWG